MVVLDRHQSALDDRGACGSGQDYLDDTPTGLVGAASKMALRNVCGPVLMEGGMNHQLSRETRFIIMD